MSDIILKQVKDICRAYNLLLSRQKGQNFLINQKIIEKIIAVADLKPDDTVLEVGPGLGILTEGLIKKAKKVISVELDAKLYNFLKAKFAGAKNLELINQDILKSQILSARGGSALGGKSQNYKIVANLPYNITSNFLKKFLTSEARPEAMTLLVQKEVAQRICARPKKMSLLAVSIQLYGEPMIIEYVDKNNFWPKPEVDSAILKISDIRDQKSVDKFFGKEVIEKNFWQLLHIGFSAKRKQLQNNLANGLKIDHQAAKRFLQMSNLSPLIRPQDLSLANWLTLAKKLNFYLN
ncbi:MAG: ribosomal RNA small subunit methyltransferase A [Candidatus Buchananbacteria bacterium RIFCSPHIGHO2_01_FULL_39_14]|uniref:Ribosomal RNA small subunit methyltransferase A n=2 Tax=Candidatus Buchananiibacteriota TaxID=1817903 RepID=A0A1G1YX09_9BACT|nr:MAG: ribosomal RNA small subunit methyltransferase A [Candidatus Buchananbacteria bacterium RIFCSPHIGHO2_01_FULL_39_14]OGY48342.1 MAG: ribosomal RNA small subunit methyltransferase A [Candidatus Buchananbacteria bacterium RIFCSPHIGHO2_02_FULL_39_17]OGY55937.1 MAG: ribosomal RNA small subunit methyltransferase A [Candidatus Buchananbacteria bacterium RIFCSPLOWO2_01_FULL_40_23b]